MNFSFGRTAAAVKLEQLVKDNPSARRKVTTLLSDYTNKLLIVTQAKDPETVRLCMEMLRDYTLRRLDVKQNIPPEVKTYTQNVIIARYRVFRKGFDDVVRILKNKTQK